MAYYDLNDMWESSDVYGIESMSHDFWAVCRAKNYDLKHIAAPQKAPYHIAADISGLVTSYSFVTADSEDAWVIFACLPKVFTPGYNTEQIATALSASLGKSVVVIPVFGPSNGDWQPDAIEDANVVWIPASARQSMNLLVFVQNWVNKFR